MICFDCHAAGQDVAAAAVCVACGAGVCARCAQVGSQTLHRQEGMGSAEATLTTRVINCPECAKAMHEHHPDGQGLNP